MTQELIPVKVWVRGADTPITYFAQTKESAFGLYLILKTVEGIKRVETPAYSWQRDVS